MKIFFYKYGSICEPDISDSFRRLGFEVIDEDMEIYNKNLLPSQCVETVSKKLIDGQFTFVFTINFFPWLSDLCEIMHLKYISLIVDSPVLELYSYSLKNDCNRIFLFDRCLYNEFEPFNQGIYSTFHLLQMSTEYKMLLKMHLHLKKQSLQAIFHLSAPLIRKNVLSTGQN